MRRKAAATARSALSWMRREERDWARLRGDEVGEELEGAGVEVEVEVLSLSVEGNLRVGNSRRQ
jgi:hypothetical protein